MATQPHRYLTQLIQEPTLSAVLVTNTSGGTLSVAFWDVFIFTSFAFTAAGFSATTVQLLCDTTVVTQFNVLHSNGTAPSNAPIKIDMAGQQFTLANTKTIVIAQAVPANTFVRTHCSIAVDMVSGS